MIKLIYNYRVNQIKWEDGDREVLIETILEDLEGGAVRFPGESLKYCECSADSLMKHYKKGEYLNLNPKPIVLDCFNTYQEAIYNASSLD